MRFLPEVSSKLTFLAHFGDAYAGKIFHRHLLSQCLHHSPFEFGLGGLHKPAHRRRVEAEFLRLRRARLHVPVRTFGAQIASTGTTPNPYLYSGERFDSNLSLYHLRARYYNMFTERQTQKTLQ
jgi:hypothetical protein